MDELQEVKVSIENLRGGKIYSYTYKNTKSIKLDLPALSKDLNVIRINDGNRIITKKLLIQ